MTVFWMPVAYEATVREPRWQGEKDLLIREAVPVEVDEATESQLPLAIEGDRSYRHDGKSWWRPLTDPAGQHAQTIPEQWQGQWADYPLGSPSPFAQGVHVPSGSAVIRNSFRPGRLADAARAAASLRVLDGRIWTRCEEPVIVLHADDGLLRRRGIVDLLPSDRIPEDAAIFGIDRRGNDLSREIARLGKTGISVTGRPTFRLLRDVPVRADLFSLRAAMIRKAVAAVIAEFPIDLSAVDEPFWRRALEQGELGNDWEFLDALESASESDHPDIGPAARFITQCRNALAWMQIARDLEASRLASLEL